MKLKVFLLFPLMIYAIVIGIYLHHPEQIILGLGAGMNMLVVSLNGFKMPVKGIDCSKYKKHQNMTDDTKLKFLADIIRTPWSIYSIGDLFIYAGVFGIFYRIISEWR